MAGTNGSLDVTGGAAVRARLIVGVVAAITLVFAAVNALTVGDDLREAGQRVAAWEP